MLLFSLKKSIQEENATTVFKYAKTLLQTRKIRMEKSVLHISVGNATTNNGIKLQLKWSSLDITKNYEILPKNKK